MTASKLYRRYSVILLSKSDSNTLDYVVHSVIMQVYGKLTYNKEMVTGCKELFNSALISDSDTQLLILKHIANIISIKPPVPKQFFDFIYRERLVNPVDIRS
jgi:hypothetical protein